MVTVLVTGVAGFIGSNLAQTLLECGHDVRGIDNLETGRQENLESLFDHSSFEFQEIDIRNEDDVVAATQDINSIYHQAAVASVPRSIEDPQTSTHVNCVGTANLIAGAREHNVETIISASSSSVYGSTGSLPRQETDRVHPESPYALSKYYTEQLTLQAQELYNISGIALRYFNVFGPRQDPRGEYAAVIPKFIRRMLDGERPVIYGDGEQTRDFIYVDNVIEANIVASQQDQGNEVYNIASGKRITINDLVKELNDILKTDLNPIYENPRPGEIKHSGAKIVKASSEMGFKPTVGFREGLERTVEWMK